MDFTILVLWVICLLIILIYKDFELNDKISELNSVIDGMEKRLENLRIAKKNDGAINAAQLERWIDESTKFNS